MRDECAAYVMCMTDMWCDFRKCGVCDVYEMCDEGNICHVWDANVMCC